MTTRHIARMAAAILLAVSTAQADVIHVDAASCPGPGSGSERDPYCSIQTAIDAAADTDEVIVAPGTYFETINFLGKAITLRSSDGPEVTTIDGTGNFHVVQCVGGEGPDTVLDGFTITGGKADGAGYPDSHGGGMFIEVVSPTVTDCTFTGNTAVEGGGLYSGSSTSTVSACRFSGNTAERGGGMNNVLGSPTVTDCTFEGNTAYQEGGGMYNAGSSPTVGACVFEGNTASGDGGGMASSGGTPIVTDCTFSENSAPYGGGMSNSGGSPTVTNCRFSGNTASGDSLGGGGMSNLGGSPLVTNCTFSGNSASVFGGGMSISSGSTVTNCILWGDSPDEIAGPGGTFPTYSNVQGGWPGTGNINADPLFVDPDNGDFRLSPNSPCIDTGDNAAVPKGVLRDLDGNPRFVADACAGAGGATVDMGAYEFQGTSCNLSNMLALLAAWGPCSDCGNCPADFDSDCSVGILDLLILLGNWG